MIRWIAALATLFSLTGCVTTEYVYRDRYYDRYEGYSYDDGYGRRVYVDSGSHYSPSYAGRGDYYIGTDYGWSDYGWYDYPAYYSVFWPMRSWYDPYWYPGYYYGVTFFPRSYWNVGLSYGWPHYSSWYYSPYRYSFADNYYDWRPWYGGGYRGQSHYAPRFGSARNEAERLSRRADAGWDYGRGGAYRGDRTAGRDERVSESVRRTPYGTYGTTRSSARDADYASPGSARRDIGQRGFGLPSDEARRQAPGTRGLGVPDGAAGYSDRGGEDTGGYSRRSEGEAMRELRRQSYEEGLALPGSTPSPRESGSGYQRYTRQSEAMRQSRSRRGYGADDGTRGEATQGGWAQPQRGYWAEPRSSGYAPREEISAGGYGSVPRDRSDAREAVSSYESAPEYDSTSRYESPPRYESTPAQSYSAPSRETPRWESRGSDFGGGRSESRGGESGSRGEVRRVGNNRDD